jgi:APA family basic amino acid/polyamine antiporter
MSITLCGLMPYKQLGVDAPVAAALRFAAGGKLDWLATAVDIAVLCGLSSVVLVLLLGQPRIFYSMSKDGLLPPVFSKIHPRFKTPHITTMLTGVVCALIAGLVPDALIGELVSIGTLLAFVVVCVGIIVLRKTKPDLPRPFKTPFVPVVPILGAILCLSQTIKLPWDTWLRLLIWMAIGVVIYFGYSIRHSKLRQKK